MLSPAPPPRGHNRHGNGTAAGDGATTVTTARPHGKPIRPKWLKTPEAIAEAAARRAARKAEEK